MPSQINTVKQSWFKSIVAAVLGPLLVFAMYLFWTWNHGLVDQVRVIVIEPGTSLRSFARSLQQQKIISNGFPLVVLGHLTGQARRLKAGEYELASGISMHELLDQVVAGRVIQYPLILIEGWTFKQFIESMNGLPKLKRSLEGLAPAAIMQRLTLEGIHPEGMFYPDTYLYSTGTDDLSLLRLAYEKMQTRLQTEWENRSSGLPLKTKYEALILASIVEKETGRADERKMIAGVFINRLNKNMRLQTDPTVIYGMGERFDGNIRVADLRHDTPYNTYTRRGLPPTPIAMPGGDALHAVMHPVDTKALYFVARGDGSHYFSETLKEHNAAVDKFQRKRSSRKKTEAK